MALRTTASALWSRIAPAARQAYPTASTSVLGRQGRSFATEVDVSRTPSPDHSPPLNLFGVPARYAGALYTAASKAGVLGKVADEFKAVIDAADANPAFKMFLEDPTMKKSKKVAGLTEFCDGAGMQEITKNFLCVVAENGRLKQSKKIYSCLDEYVMANSGQVKATVTSAHPMEAEDLALLSAQLSTFVEEGQTLMIDTKVDPRIVGGFTVAMGEDYYDLSLMTRIRHVEQELNKPLNATEAKAGAGGFERTTFDNGQKGFKRKTKAYAAAAAAADDDGDNEGADDK